MKRVMATSPVQTRVLRKKMSTERTERTEIVGVCWAGAGARAPPLPRAETRRRAWRACRASRAATPPNAADLAATSPPPPPAARERTVARDAIATDCVICFHPIMEGCVFLPCGHAQ